MSDRNVKEVCKNCMYSESERTMDGIRRKCRRFPPVMMESHSLFSAEDYSFPCMRRDDWCYEFKER